MTFDIQIMHWPTIDEFAAYLRGVPRPAWCIGITDHNTYIPNELQWRGLASMHSMRDTYISKGWSAGPNLYLAASAPYPADCGIWQMTPITHPGVHAGACNADHLGVENVGDFDARPPTAAQYALLIDVNLLFVQQWGLSVEKVNVHNECMTGRTCPGRYLTGAQIRLELARRMRPSTPVTPESTLLAPPRATEAQCVAALLQHPNGDYTPYDVRSIVRSYFVYASGLDPLLAIAQLCHETAYLSSDWAARPHRNPAGIGVTGEPGAGLSFATWELAAKSHIGRLLAYALPVGQGSAAQRQLILGALHDRPLPLMYRGSAVTLQGLGRRWAVPGTGYAQAIAAIANQIAGL